MRLERAAHELPLPEALRVEPVRVGRVLAAHRRLAVADIMNCLMVVRRPHGNIVEHRVAAVTNDKHSLILVVACPVAIDLLSQRTCMLHIRIRHVSVRAVKHVNVT